MATTSGTAPPKKRVAIIYHYLAHYREAVFASLSRDDARHRYEVFASKICNIHSMSTIEPSQSNSITPGGALNWRFIRNYWLSSSILWQSDAVKIAWRRDHDVIILLGNMHFLSTWLAAGIGRLRGKRILMWTHGVLRDERGLRGVVRRAFYHLAHGLLLYGNRARRILAERGFSEHNLYVVYNSLDTATQLHLRDGLAPEAMANARQRAGIAPGVPFLINIGRMTKDKDLHLLPRALHELKVTGRRVDLVFVGDGPVRMEIECVVRDLDLGQQVHFLGEVYAEAALCPLIAAADICVCPGAVGLTAMHALIYGTPVITHDQPDWQKPEHEAIVPGITGNTFRRGDASDLAATIANWLSTGRDRAEVAKACRDAILGNYTPEAQRRAIDAAVDGIPATEMKARFNERDGGTPLLDPSHG